MKYLVLAVALATLVLMVSADYGLQHNGFWGTRDPQDVLLFRDTFVAKGKVLRVNKLDVSYPRRDQVGGTITAINVFDGFTNGKGGYSYLKSGGIGQNYATLRLKSQHGKAMHFTVEIYGKQ